MTLPAVLITIFLIGSGRLLNAPIVSDGNTSFITSGKTLLIIPEIRACSMFPPLMAARPVCRPTLAAFVPSAPSSAPPIKLPAPAETAPNTPDLSMSAGSAPCSPETAILVSAPLVAAVAIAAAEPGTAAPAPPIPKGANAPPATPAVNPAATKPPIRDHPPSPRKPPWSSWYTDMPGT